jgi:hypothetical protein
LGFESSGNFMSTVQKLFFAILSGSANQKSYRSMRATLGEVAWISIRFEPITTLSGLTTLATPDSNSLKRNIVVHCA